MIYIEIKISPCLFFWLGDDEMIILPFVCWLSTYSMFALASSCSENGLSCHIVI